MEEQWREIIHGTGLRVTGILNGDGAKQSVIEMIVEESGCN